MNGLHGRKMRGFTLLELLIALAIFGLLSVMSYSGLRSVMEQSTRTAESADRLVELQKIYLAMQRDLEQIVPRMIRGEYGNDLPAVAGSEVLEFTRGGRSNPLEQPRSNLQRVGYAFEDSKLMRYSWQVLDRAQDSQPRKQPLSEAITNMSIRYLTVEDEWLTSWPPEDAAAGQAAAPDLPDPRLLLLPAALEVTLEHERFGEVVWLFQLPK